LPHNRERNKGMRKRLGREKGVTEVEERDEDEVNHTRTRTTTTTTMGEETIIINIIIIIKWERHLQTFQ